MKIAITGANGFVGKKLTEFLVEKGFDVKRISRLLIFGDPEGLASAVAGADAVIHLAGAPVMRRWTKKNRRVIYNSRVISTWNLTKALNMLEAEQKPEVLISISAVGIYATGRQHDEQSLDFNGQFPGKLAVDWENASIDLDKNIRRIIFRSGIVLGKESQIIQNLLPLFRIGLGGRIGNGRQPFPFIHIDDLTRAFYEAIINKNFQGIYNLVAPDQVTNKTFTLLMSQKLNKPAFFHVPSGFLRLIYGKASVMLLESPSVVPKGLTDIGFPFCYPTLSETLDEIVSPRVNRTK